MKTLNDLSPGEEGIVKKLGSSGTLRRRMIDMGITAGAKVKLIKSAPSGDPIEIKIHDYNLSIRRSEAIEVELFSTERPTQKLEIGLDLKPGESKKHAFNLSVPCEVAVGKEKIYKVALVGNPNSGKTTLFNQLTGSYQYVGNWPGVTVERKEGRIKNTKEIIDLIDLPGVYSLSPYSPEEVVTRNYIMNEMPNVIINIVDSTNLERNLYLTTQLLELDCKVILVLNMSDLLEKKGKKIDCKELEKVFGIPTVIISAGKNKGIDNLLEVLSVSIKDRDKVRYTRKIYSSKVENALDEIENYLNPGKTFISNSRFKTIKIFEGDPLILKEFNLTLSQIDKIERLRDKISKIYEKEKDTIIPDERYMYIHEIYRKAVKSLNCKKRICFSDKIDKFLTGKYTAIPCFIGMVLSIFYLTFGPLGIMLKNICEDFINIQTKGTVSKILNYTGASEWSKKLVLDAVIGGVGGVISFLPQIILLFTLLSLLEDCGYMARAAFIMDKPMRKVGLSGKAFVPLIMGFGCTVPAVMGTKILENKKDKNLSIFLIPFMSCSAKMPVYLMFASTFFPHHQTLVIFSLYIIGIICAVFTAYLFKDSVFKGEASPFIMEMPDYKWPSAKNVRLSVWDKTRDFVERAGTVILIATVVVWFLQYFGIDLRPVQDSSSSILAKIGNFISPLFSICGFNDWRICVSLLTGVMAKESIVSTLSVLYSSAGWSDVSQGLLNSISLPSAVSVLIFILLYTPCIAAISTIYREVNNKKYAIFSVLYQLFIAYVMSALVYQFTMLFSRIL